MNSKSRLKRRRIGSLILAVLMVLTMLPAPVSAEVTDTHDWEIFDADDQYNLPETQEVVLQRMLQKYYWGTIVKEIIKQQQGSDKLDIGPYIYYQNLTADSPLIMKDSLSAAYNEAAGKLISAINGFNSTNKEDLEPTKNFLNNQGNRIAQIDTEGPAFARYQVQTRKTGDSEFFGYYGAAGAITIQLFYDFKVEGLPGKFNTPDFEVGDTEAELNEQGITFALGGSSDSYTVRAENPNDFANTIQKSYTYEKSTSTSTEVSNSYSREWSEETTVGVEIGIPVVSLAGLSVNVEQKVGYSYGLSKTYSSAKSDTYSQSITDTIEVPLPPHTGIDIDVTTVDSTTSIPYTGAARVTYKTMVVYAAGVSEYDGESGSRKNTNGSFSFGDGAYSAIQDLDRRIVNAMGPDSDRDRLDLRSTGNGLMANSDFKYVANTLLSGQPYSPYAGVFSYTSKGTRSLPKIMSPLYP